MRYALTSDLDGDVSALRTVLRDLDDPSEVDRVFRLGDLGGVRTLAE
ncbi:MAG TPA: hypothetical protein VFI39_09740 [Gemmatimonadales bacterium]|nr:hypothetical protein [Gemmatimonadales bacterium]